MGTEWKNYTPAYVSSRYNYIAPVYPVFEWIFLLPKNIRRKTIDAIGLSKGDCVLEIGCGTGRNLQLLSEAAGPAGKVYAVDVSEGMLRKAMETKEHKKLLNIEIIYSDAALYIPPVKINAVLFSLSYATMIERKKVLKNAWDFLQPGGKIVIMDAQYPTGTMGKIITPVKPLVTLFLKATVLGNPHIQPIKELKEIAGAENVTVKILSMGTYFIAAAKKAGCKL
jgi:ubiquinone/menaquinone biosynthesis C-methylase UbiE